MKTIYQALPIKLSTNTFHAPRAKTWWIGEATVLGKVIVKVTPGSRITCESEVLDLLTQLVTDYTINLQD